VIFLCFLNERLQLEFREYEIEKECGLVRHSTKNVDRLQEEREREEESVCIVGSQGQVRSLLGRSYSRSNIRALTLPPCKSQHAGTRDVIDGDGNGSTGMSRNPPPKQPKSPTTYATF